MKHTTELTIDRYTVEYNRVPDGWTIVRRYDTLTEAQHHALTLTRLFNLVTRVWDEQTDQLASV